MAPESRSGEAASLQKKLTSLATGPLVLRTLFEDVPLSADGSKDDIKINCVDYFGRILEPHGQMWDSS